MPNLPTPRELAERELSRARKAAFGPVLLRTLLRGQEKRHPKPKRAEKVPQYPVPMIGFDLEKPYHERFLVT